MMDHPLSAPVANDTAATAATVGDIKPASSGSAATLLHSRGPVPALDRDSVKAWVLRTYTADEGFPVISSVVTEVSRLSEDERARLRLQRLEVMSSGAQMATSGGVVTAPVQKAGAAASQQQQPPQQQQQKHTDPAAGRSPTSPNAPAGSSPTAAAAAAAASASSGGEETSLGVSQNEIVHMLETMDSELKRHWEAGDRVKALRLAIQATKMLSHAGRVPSCFPSMFVLVATVLDSLGDRVADRLEALAVSREPIIERLLAEGKDLPFVPPEAAELCGNWFHKILSIRELLCRVTVELALLKCFKYAGEKSHVPVKQVIVRLANQIRGVANAQVASHLRWYLFLRARDELSRGKKNPGSWAQCLAQCAVDNLDMMSRMALPPACSASADKADAFMATFQPSMRWMFDTIVRYGGSAAPQFVAEALHMLQECPQLQCGSVAIVFLQCAPPGFLFKNFDDVWASLIENEAMSYSTPQSKLQAVAELTAALADPASGVTKLSKNKRAQMLNLLFGAIADYQPHGTVEAHFHALTAVVQFTARLMPFSAVATVLGEVRTLVVELEQKKQSNIAPGADAAAAATSG